MRINKFKTAVAGGATCLLAGTLAFTVIAGPDASEPEAIADALCLRKMALDLTHRGPTVEEISRVESGQATLADMADEYMGSAEFGDVVFNWYRSQFPLTEISPEGVDHEEPSRIARHIVVEDRDYREIMTGDYTITPEGEQVAVSDRPPAGVISTQHYMSAFTGSFRRNWAGHFLKEWSGVVLEAVSLPPEAEDDDLSPDTIATNPACAGCHVNEIYGVDPLAALSACYDEAGNHIADCTDAKGSFLTVEANGIQELGKLMVASNEWKSQAVDFFYQQLFGRKVAREESKFYAAAALAFQESEFRAKPLIRHLITSAQYCAN